ncbi:hypothetical protein NCC49_000136 [Naganishia albida]|nr:hypothetical protein NCC49_000136 [Naganishia albida]
MQSPAPTPALAAFQPVLPSLNTILSHINTQNTLQAQFQSEQPNGHLTDKQEEELHAYDEKISRQALQVRQSLLEQAKTAYTSGGIPGSQFSVREMQEMERALDERMRDRRRLLEQFTKMELPVSQAVRN